MKYLKNYFLFMENHSYQFGCVMINFKFDESKKIQSTINEEDIFEIEDEQYGLENNPHLTLLYGLHKEVTTEDVKKVLENFDLKNLEIKINGIGSFENDNFDVLKFDVENTSLLQEIHDALSELPNSDKYPDYSPHITIAYLKKGTSKKYLDKNFKNRISNFTHTIYSITNGEKIMIEI